MRLVPPALSLVFAFAVSLPTVALADIAPLCTEVDKYPGCDAANVGKACDDKNANAKCAELFCEATGASKVYKCVVACQDVVPKGTGDACNPGATTCGTNGTCKTYEGECYGNLYSRSYCDDGSGTAGAGGTSSGTAGASGSGTGTAGTSAGSTPADDDSGCAVSSTGKRGMLASFITLAGALALFATRRRSR